MIRTEHIQSSRLNPKKMFCFWFLYSDVFLCWWKGPFFDDQILSDPFFGSGNSWDTKCLASAWNHRRCWWAQLRVVWWCWTIPRRLFVVDSDKGAPLVNPLNWHQNRWEVGQIPRVLEVLMTLTWYDMIYVYEISFILYIDITFSWYLNARLDNPLPLSFSPP